MTLALAACSDATGPSNTPDAAGVRPREDAGRAAGAGTRADGGAALDGGGANPDAAAGTDAATGTDDAGGTGDAGAAGPRVLGRVTRAADGTGVSGARVMLFRPQLDFFAETRTDASGAYTLAGAAPGEHALGVAARGFEYVESALQVTGGEVSRDVALEPESEPGRWTLVGDTAPEYLEGTGWGTLLYTGEVFICHDSNDPVVFDPFTATRWFPQQSNVEQGCHLEALLTSGEVLIAGGSTEGLPQQNVVRTTKVFQRATGSWALRSDLGEGRWYPGGVRMPDEGILALGGEGEPDGYGRVDSCEVYDPNGDAWTPAPAFDLPVEMPPALLLLDGDVFKSWRYPERLTPGSAWRAAAPMQQERVGAAGGDHSDHEIVYLADGRVMAIGIDPAPSVQAPSMVELYDPGNDRWTVGPTPEHLRRAPEALVLPDGRVLAFGGTYTGDDPSAIERRNAGTVPDCTNVTDLFDPQTDRWRSVAPLSRFIHYHNVTVLSPDGRVIATGGAGTGSGRVFGDDTSIEAYEPPYLFRGPRPRIVSVSTTDLSAGESFTLDVALAAEVTQVVLLGARASTHWIDTGTHRYLSLPFAQAGSTVTATVPGDPVAALAGWYIVFALVDDVPSVGRMVRITADAAPPPLADLASVSIAADDASASESGADAARVVVSRTGSLAAPLTVALAFSGTAISGSDYEGASAYVVIATSTASAELTLRPLDDGATEGDETIAVTVVPQAHYGVGTSERVTLTLVDDD